MRTAKFQLLVDSQNKHVHSVDSYNMSHVERILQRVRGLQSVNHLSIAPFTCRQAGAYQSNLS